MTRGSSRQGQPVDEDNRRQLSPAELRREKEKFSRQFVREHPEAMCVNSRPPDARSTLVRMSEDGI